MKSISFGVPPTCSECPLASVSSFAGKSQLTRPPRLQYCRRCKTDDAVAIRWSASLSLSLEGPNNLLVAADQVIEGGPCPVSSQPESIGRARREHWQIVQFRSKRRNRRGRILLVIDEASQLRPGDALGLVSRCRRIVVVGDKKHLPPTSFFDRMIADEADAGDGKETAIRHGESAAPIADLEHTFLVRGARPRKPDVAMALPGRGIRP